MKTLISIFIGLLIVGCGKEEKTGQVIGEIKGQNERVSISDIIVEREIRKALNKPEGKLTKTDMRKVSELRLHGNRLIRPINDLSLKDVAQLENLGVLYLLANPITDKGLKDLAKLQKLYILHLSSELITDAGLKDISEINKLEMLTLGGANRITDTGLSHLVDLENLRYLDLGGCGQITDKGIKEIVRLKNLSRLMLGGTRITGTGLKEITTLTQLTDLSLGNNPNLTKAQIDELKKALPKCKIEHNAKK